MPKRDVQTLMQEFFKELVSNGFFISVVQLTIKNALKMGKNYCTNLKNSLIQ